MKIICLCGKSASGKNRISELCKETLGMKEIISHTNRPKRNGESENTYHFVTEDKIKKMIDNNEMIEYRVYNTIKGIWYYGVAKDSIDLNSDKNYIVILDVKGLKQLQDYLIEQGKINCLISIYINVSGQIRLKRSLNREGKMTDEQIAEIIRRYQKDNEDFADVLQYVDYSFDNANGFDLEKILNKIKKLLED